MSDPSTTLTNPNQVSGDDEPDTESEFRTLYTDAGEGRDRFAALAKAAEDAGNADVAKVYREIGGTVMTLLMDLAAATAASLVNVEDRIDDLPGGGASGGSGLLQEDADKYLQLFEQFIRLLDGLTGVVPAGVDGDAQREVFATLRRMTEGMADFTKSIVIADEEEDEDDEEEDEDDEEEPDGNT
jgi:hypothetical protein